MRAPLYLILLSASILIPFFIGLVRLRRIKRSSYQPFFALILLGVLSEIVSSFLIRVLHIHNAVSNNMWFLTEWLLIATQFRMWGVFRNRKKVYYLLLFIPCLAWVTENLCFGQIGYFSPYYQVLYCFLVVILSVNTINFMITHDYRNLFGNATFLICIAFIIYFIYRIVFNWAYQTSLRGTTQTTSLIITLMSYVNALTNIIFAIALLRIPRPQKFTLK
ncbi:MAG TPA: hypothetical protein VNW04_20865 [Puia sp.]|jgi:hypothetical protein|nr:hypothetical protein [Puia sp.]